MKKTTKKTYEFVLKNLQDTPLAFSKSIIPSGSYGKVVLKDLQQVQIAQTLASKGLVEVISGWTPEDQKELGSAKQTPPIVTVVEDAVVSTVTTVTDTDSSSTDSVASVELAFAEPLSIEQIEAMTREDMIEFAKTASNLEIGKRTPFDVAQNRLKAYFGYATE